jgi:hypothetical protein
LVPSGFCANTTDTARPAVECCIHQWSSKSTPLRAQLRVHQPPLKPSLLRTAASESERLSSRCRASRSASGVQQRTRTFCVSELWTRRVGPGRAEGAAKGLKRDLQVFLKLLSYASGRNTQRTTRMGGRVRPLRIRGPSCEGDCILVSSEVVFEFLWLSVRRAHELDSDPSHRDARPARPTPAELSPEQRRAAAALIRRTVIQGLSLLVWPRHRGTAVSAVVSLVTIDHKWEKFRPTRSPGPGPSVSCGSR